MVDVAQLVRAEACGASGCGFEPRRPPKIFKTPNIIFSEYSTLKLKRQILLEFYKL
jgi:hypothetical protein